MSAAPALAFAAGAKASAADALSRIFGRMPDDCVDDPDQREIVALLNDDARFAFPFGDGYWSLLLDRSFVYEGEIEQLFSERRRRRLWLHRRRGELRVLVGSSFEPPVRQPPPAIAIEALVRPNATKLVRNAEDQRRAVSRCCTAPSALRSTAARFGSADRSTRRSASAMRTAQEPGEQHSRRMTLDSLLEQGLVSAQHAPCHQARRRGNGSRRGSKAPGGCWKAKPSSSSRIMARIAPTRVSRYLLTGPSCRVFVYDPAIQRYERLIDFSTLDRIKTSTVFGYNVFATNSSSWARKDHLDPSVNTPSTASHRMIEP